MVFNATFNNISVISWWSVLLVEEIRVPGENHQHEGIRLYYFFYKRRKKISKYHFKNKIIDILNILRPTRLWNNAQIPSSYKPITNTAWVRAQLCKLQKGCTRLAAASDKVYQLLAQSRWFSSGTSASSTTKAGRHDRAEILLKVALNTKIQIQIPKIRKPNGINFNCLNMLIS